jgi:hypothetical protein
MTKVSRAIAAAKVTAAKWSNPPDVVDIQNSERMMYQWEVEVLLDKLAQYLKGKEHE